MKNLYVAMAHCGEVPGLRPDLHRVSARDDSLWRTFVRACHPGRSEAEIRDLCEKHPRIVCFI